MDPKIVERMKLVGEVMTRSDFKDAFQRAIGMIRLAIEQLEAKIDKQLASVRDGIDGKDGRDGKDGKDGRDGKDGVSIVGPVGPKGETIVGPRGADGKDGSPDTAEDIRNKLELLFGEDRLDAKYIKNLPEATKTIVETSSGGGYSALKDLPDVKFAGITNGQSLKWNHAMGKWIPYTPAGASAWSTPAEPVNGSTTVFTVTAEPTDVIADGVMLFAGQGYTYAALQVTFTNPPAQYVRYR